MNYEAKLCTGRVVKVRELTGKEEQLVFRAVGQIEQNAADMKRVVNEMVKMMLVEVDGKPVNYQELQEKDLSDIFRVKEMRQLEELYQELHAPTEAENKDFLKTIRPL